ncbi:MAG: PAS domain-containing protein, partial [Chloroflexota bacterium]
MKQAKKMNGHGGRKDAARRRRQSEQRAGGGNIYRMALEAARDAILIVSPEGVIIDVNAACMAALGYESKGQLVGKSVFDAVTIEGADELRENVVRAL